MTEHVANEYRVRCVGRAPAHDAYFDMLADAEEWASEPEQVARFHMLIVQKFSAGKWEDVSVGLSPAV